MDPLISVILSYVLYMFYVLLPMVPAVLIYKWFPDTKVSVSGPLSKLTLNSTGAFAAYVVVVILGFFIIKDTHSQILDMNKPVWTVKIPVELQDEKGKKINYPEILENMEIYLDPKIKTVHGHNVVLKLPGQGKRIPDHLIVYKIQDFGQADFDLSDLKFNEVDVDDNENVITVKKPVVIQRRMAPQPYKYANEAATKPATPAGGPALRY